MDHFHNYNYLNTRLNIKLPGVNRCLAYLNLSIEKTFLSIIPTQNREMIIRKTS